MNQQSVVCHNLEGREHLDERIVKQLSTCENQQSVVCRNLEEKNTWRNR
jgi:hypothetical protein